MAGQKSVAKIRKVLRAGSVVFGFSAVILVILPGFFNQLLGFATNPELEWAMRMIGITLVALSGNMFSVSTRGSEKSVLYSGRVMTFSAGALGLLTLMVPGGLNWFSILYAVVGFGFATAYYVAFRK